MLHEHKGTGGKLPPALGSGGVALRLPAVEQLHWKGEFVWDNPQKFYSSSGGYVRPVSFKVSQNWRSPRLDNLKEVTLLQVAGPSPDGESPVSCWVASWHLGPASVMTGLEGAGGRYISRGKNESLFYSDECNMIAMFGLTVTYVL